jgi:hypothetical protein
VWLERGLDVEVTATPDVESCATSQVLRA